MSQNYEVIIVGAGPAGSTLAYGLASRGIKVLVIDKAIFPRYKCCGGGLTFKMAVLLGEDITTIVENSVSGALLAVAGSNHFQVDYDKTIIYTIRREKLDYLLLQKAEKAGAKILQGVIAGSLNTNKRYVEVATSAGDFKSQFVMGADGSRSIAAISINPAGYENIVGIQTEIKVSNRDLEKFQSRVVIDLGRAADGYAWLFPNQDRLSVGIAGIKAKGGDLKIGYRQFLRALNINEYTILKRSGGIISICTGRPRVTRGRIALLGDAAGLADPLTGEGLYNAILSARLAAPAIENSLLDGDSTLDAYQRSVDEQVTPQIEAARTFSRILKMMSGSLLNQTRIDDRIWKKACALVRGEITYTEIKDRIGSLGGLAAILLRK